MKRLFCKHDYYTVSNLGGDAINWFSNRKILFPRSIKECRKCRKRILSNQLDKDCKKINEL